MQISFRTYMARFIRNRTEVSCLQPSFEPIHEKRIVATKLQHFVKPRWHEIGNSEAEAKSTLSATSMIAEDHRTIDTTSIQL